MIAAWNYLLSLPGGSTIIAALIALVTALITALVTLLGIGIGLWAHSVRERTNRTVEIRRQVFLESVEGISSAFDWLAHMSDPFTSDQDLSTLLRDYAAKTAKVEIVAKQSTINALYEFKRAVTNASVAFGTLRGEMMMAKKRMDQAMEMNERAVKFFEDRVKIETGLPTAVAESLQKALDEINSNARTAQMEMKVKSMDIAEVAMQSEQNIARAQDCFTVAARADLGFRINEEGFLEAGRKLTSHHQEVYSNGIKKFRSILAEQKDSPPRPSPKD